MLMDKVIGHRGVAAEAPENTLAGCRMAAEKGFRWIEVDVTLLGDQTAVLFHDRRLNRTTNKKGSLRAACKALLADIDAGSWLSSQFAGEPIPTLHEALVAIKQLNVGLNIEIKVNGCSKRQLVTTLLKEIGNTGFPKDRLVVSSFNYSALKMFADESDIATACLFERLPLSWKRKARKVNARSINLGQAKVSRIKIEKVKAAGFEVYCYTVNSKERFEKLLAWGVDGVFTDTSSLLDK
ncbi:glycerophosphodiester phosphodiesterase family protein [Endozoicomonas ascidiicola]|uniref:glycerophosphodiester phosphodiesterase family protein n=1 Tax=Endozoicomonas ascidiicola TaxID=1698521 RepID=UPI0008355326|nr:glycerophosphodiester phosphodiesterase family protein [Endozoicomonas ascidiicola]